MKLSTDDLDVALGEILHLCSVAKQLNVCPTELDKQLSFECMSVIHAQPKEACRRAVRIINRTLRRD